jgi:cytochrome c551/c552
LLALFRDPSHLPAVTAAAEARPATQAVLPPANAPHQQAAGAGPGEAAAGLLVFQKYGCNGCHAVRSLPEAQSTIGPVLDGLAQRASSRIPGVPGEEYIRQSIAEPGAYVVQGYLKLMPALRSSMSEQELADLLAWLGTL